MSIGEEHQVVKRGGEYHDCGEEYNGEKREGGSDIIFPKILRLLGRITSGEKGKGTEIWEENQKKVLTILYFPGL